MPRKGPVPKREVLPDPLYNSRLVTKFVNRLMYDGKKGAAEKIFYSSLETLGEKTGEDPMRAFEKAMDNVKPHLEVKARRDRCRRPAVQRKAWRSCPFRRANGHS